MLEHHDGVRCCNKATECCKLYNERYDAYYCSKCDTWLESKCDDPECDYCIDRPEKPSECES